MSMGIISIKLILPLAMYDKDSELNTSWLQSDPGLQLQLDLRYC